ncbi:MAG: hypothetical protein ABSE25_11875 [Syntrophorhabdales bacterium]
MGKTLLIAILGLMLCLSFAALNTASGQAAGGSAGGGGTMGGGTMGGPSSGTIRVAASTGPAARWVQAAARWVQAEQAGIPQRREAR